MKKVKFILLVILMALFNRPQNWSYHYRILKEKYLDDNSKNDLY